RVPFWGIGNEAWGCGGNMSAEHYAEELRRYATFCRDHGDNKLYRIAAGAADDDYRWTETLMKAISCLGCTREPRNIFQGLTFHYYTVPGPWEHKGSATEFGDDEYYTTLAKAARAEELIAGHSAVMDCYDPHKRVGLILDEWGTWYDVEPGTNPGFLYQQNTLRDALVASVHFDAFHRHADRLVMANIAQTVNVLQAMLLTDPDTGALVRTPTFHVFAMNAGHQDADSLAAHVIGAEERSVDGRDLPLVHASASRRGDTALVSLSNLDADEARAIVLDLRGAELEGWNGTVLTAGDTAAPNAPDTPDAVAPAPLEGVRRGARGLEVDLPAHAFATIELALA